MANDIKYIPYGIASRVGDKIYMNKRLNSYPKLKKAILKHEKNHTDGFSTRDFLLDVHLEELKGVKKEYYRFVAGNPSSWVEFLPIKKYGGTVLFNLPVAVLWFATFVMIWFIISSIF